MEPGLRFGVVVWPAVVNRAVVQPLRDVVRGCLLQRGGKAESLGTEPSEVIGTKCRRSRRMVEKREVDGRGEDRI